MAKRRYALPACYQPQYFKRNGKKMMRFRGRRGPDGGYYQVVRSGCGSTYRRYCNKSLARRKAGKRRTCRR